MQNRYFAYFSDFSHIGVDFRILICEFAYAWRPCLGGRVGVGRGGFELRASNQPKALHLIGLDFWVWGRGGGGGGG